MRLSHIRFVGFSHNWVAFISSMWMDYLNAFINHFSNELFSSSAQEEYAQPWVIRENNGNWRMIKYSTAHCFIIVVLIYSLSQYSLKDMHSWSDWGGRWNRKRTTLQIDNTIWTTWTPVVDVLCCVIQFYSDWKQQTLTFSIGNLLLYDSEQSLNPSWKQFLCCEF